MTVMSINAPLPDEAAARAWIARLREQAQPCRTRHDGGRLTWHCVGDGPPVVLLHGGHGSWLHWARNLEALAVRHRVWAADMPGYGDSDPPLGHSRDSTTVGPLVDVLIASLRECLGASPFDLVGFSFGGLVATRVAEVLDGQVERLVLLGPAGHGGARRPRGELVNWRFAAHRGDTVALREAMRHNLAVHMLHHDAAIDPLAIAIHDISCQATRFRSKPISRSGGLLEAVARRVAAGRATHLLWGEHDVTMDPAWLREHLRDADWALQPGVGHWVQYEAAAAVNQRLEGWLAR